MGESWASANKRRACLGCGKSGAGLFVMPNGVNTRVCYACSIDWGHPLKMREPMYEETQYEGET